MELNKKTCYYKTGRSYTAYYKACEECGAQFWASRKGGRFCNKNCANTSLRLIREPLEHFFREKITRVKNNAKNRKLSFNLVWQDLLGLYTKQKGKCYYSGRFLQLTYSVKDVKICPPDQLSIDRLDSNKGYTKDNVVLCCYAINNMKGDLSEKHFKEYLNMVNNRDIRVRIKKMDDNAIIPSYAKNGDGGVDLTAVSEKWNVEEDCWEYGTGLAVEIPEGYVGLIFPRSSLSKKDLLLTNHVGVIDSGYRGEIKFKFKELKWSGNLYQKGDRIGQLIILPYPQVEFEEVNELSSTERGTGGYGSTGA